MTSRAHFKKVDNIERAVLTSEGAVDKTIREAIATYASSLDETLLEQVPVDLHDYLKKVVQHAYRVTDKDTQHLHNAGYTEEYIFEITIAAALGTAMKRFNKTMDVLDY